MLRLQRNLLAFSVGFFLTVGLMLSAYASTATNPTYGTFSFQGDSCVNLREAALAQHYIKFPSDIAYNVLTCSKPILQPGDSVTVQFASTQPGSVSIAIPYAISTVDAANNEGGYVGFVLLALCWGVGVMAGILR